MKWLGVIFSFCLLVSTFGSGNMPQIDNIASTLNSSFGLSPIVSSLVITILVGLVIIGGINRIASFAGSIVPVMAFVYIVGSLSVLIFNYSNILPSFYIIIHDVFSGSAIAGGFLGASFSTAFTYGVARGLYSNEAGQGSSPIAHATSNTKHSIEEGFVSILEPFIDTLVICTLTGLVILCTGAWQHTEYFVSISAASVNEFNQSISQNSFRGLELINGSLLTSFAFKNGLSWIFSFGDKIITLSVLLFATSTAISWSFYGDRATEYLFGEKAILPYRLVWVSVAVIAAIAGEKGLVWDVSDTLNGLMALPNLLALLLLSGTVFQLTQNHFSPSSESDS